MAIDYTNRKFSPLTVSAIYSSCNDCFYANRKFSPITVSAIYSSCDDCFYANRKFSPIGTAITFILNPPPVLDNPISDKEVVEGNTFSFTVPGDTFSDPDSEPLTLSATLDDDEPLPTWLTFTPGTDKFLGVPSHVDIGTLQIKVTATDPGGAFAFDIFALEVTEDLFLKTKDLNRSFRTMLPTGRAWNIDLSVVFKQVIDAIMSSAADVKDYFLRVFSDVFPDTTQSLELWEEQFLIDKSNLTEQQRRDVLDARWSEQGGQSPTYLEEQLAKIGIIAKVYENFNRDNPNTFLIGGDAEILVNGKIIKETKNFVNTCGNPSVTCGSGATAGEYDSFIVEEKLYSVSVLPSKYIFYFIIADPASVFTPLDVPANLEKSFKLTVLRIKPLHTRAVLNVNYI